MARPPVIISNGGVVGFLAQGIEDPEAEQKIMNNLAQLNENAIREDGVWSIARWITRKIIEVPALFWHLTDDNIEHQLTKLRSMYKDENIGLGDKIPDTE